MKLNLFLTGVVSVFTLSLNACEKMSDIPLLQQYETGALQWKIMRQEIDPNTLLHQAILENSPEVIVFLIKHGVKIDYPNENGMTPLAVAILRGSKNDTKMLLENGANPSTKCNNMSLLEIAICMRDSNSALLLVKHGADVNAGNKNQSVLSMVLDCASTGDPTWHQVAMLMIEKGANMRSAKDNEFNRPKIELVLKDTIDGSFDYHTADIEQKVHLLFLEQYSRDQSNAQFVREPYREVLMLEATGNVLDEVEDLSKVLGCEKQLWFWEMAESLLKTKVGKGGQKKLAAFIKIKKSSLIDGLK